MCKQGVPVCYLSVPVFSCSPQESGEGRGRAGLLSLTLLFRFFPPLLFVLFWFFFLFSLHVPLIDLEKKGQLKKTLR